MRKSSLNMVRKRTTLHLLKSGERWVTWSAARTASLDRNARAFVPLLHVGILGTKREKTGREAPDLGQFLVTAHSGPSGHCQATWQETPSSGQGSEVLKKSHSEDWLLLLSWPLLPQGCFGKPTQL